jgi:phosphoenolpyruvate carboxykinase (ATP)
MTNHGVRLWLVNTGWTGGGHGVGHRMKLAHTRAMISAALEGRLDDVDTAKHPIFGLEVPTACEGVPNEVWDVRSTWSDCDAYDEAANNLAQQFAANFEKFEAQATEEMRAGAPVVTSSQNA